MMLAAAVTGSSGFLDWVSDPMEFAPDNLLRAMGTCHPPTAAAAALVLGRLSFQSIDVAQAVVAASDRALAGVERILKLENEINVKAFQLLDIGCLGWPVTGFSEGPATLLHVLVLQNPRLARSLLSSQTLHRFLQGGGGVGDSHSRSRLTDWTFAACARWWAHQSARLRQSLAGPFRRSALSTRSTVSSRSTTGRSSSSAAILRRSAQTCLGC